MTNARILSPIGRTNPSNCKKLNNSGGPGKPRRFVANVIERDLFRKTFINQNDNSKREDEVKKPIDLEVFRRNQL